MFGIRTTCGISIPVILSGSPDCFCGLRLALAAEVFLGLCPAAGLLLRFVKFFIDVKVLEALLFEEFTEWAAGTKWVTDGSLRRRASLRCRVMARLGLLETSGEGKHTAKVVYAQIGAKQNLADHTESGGCLFLVGSCIQSQVEQLDQALGGNSLGIRREKNTRRESGPGNWPKARRFLTSDG